jgi:hypothetical protein
MTNILILSSLGPSFAPSAYHQLADLLCFVNCNLNFTSPPDDSLPDMSIDARTFKWQAATAVFLQLSVATATVIHGAPHVDYSACVSATAGSICTPACEVGYRPSQTFSGFTLAFDEMGNFDAAADTKNGKVECSANICSGDARNGVIDADYSSCNMFTTAGLSLQPLFQQNVTAGASVMPQREQKSRSRSVVHFHSWAPASMCARVQEALGFLVCDENGNFDAAVDAGDLACSIDKCDGIVHNSVANADYSLCGLAATGAICTPVCNDGYKTIGASASFTLVCDAQGGFNAARDTGDLECTVNSCNGIITNAVANADYSSCQTSTATGGFCVPVCANGYISTGMSDGFTLFCDDRGDFDAAADAGDLECIAKMGVRGRI